MAAQDTIDDTDIRHLIDTLTGAIRTMDLEGSEVDLCSGHRALRRHRASAGPGSRGQAADWVEAFGAFQPPLGYEIRDLTITSSGDAAFVHGLARLSGTLKNGDPVGGFWVRFTGCLGKIDGR